jgi:uncharacterized delta-60 repeat protein
MRAVHGLWSVLIWGVCVAGCGTVTNDAPDAGPAGDGGGTDGQLLVDAAPGTVTVAAPAMTFVRIGADTPITVEIARGDGVTGPVEVAVATAPAGVTFAPLVIPADASSGALVLTVAADAAFRVEALALVAAAGNVEGSAEAGIEIIGPTGAANPDFGTDGTVTLDTAVASGYVAGLVPQDDRAVIVTYDGARVVAVRIDLDGRIDTAFGDGGRAVVELAPIGVRGVRTIATSMDGDGRIVVGGAAETASAIRPFVLRLTADGELDAAVTPRLLPPSDETLFTNLVTGLPDGGITMFGSRGTGGAYQPWSVRLRENGTVISSDTPDLVPGQARWFVQSDGLIVCQDGENVARLRPSGQLDPSFGTQGRTPLPSANGPAQWTLVKQLGDKFVVGGYASAWRLDGNGALDTTFGSVGTATIPVVGLESGVNAFDSGDGHILLHTVGVPLQGSSYYVGFYDLDEGGVLSSRTGKQGVVRDVVGWLGTFSTVLDRRRILVAGDSQAPGSAIRIRQYWY